MSFRGNIEKMTAILEELGATDLPWFRMNDGSREKWRCYLGKGCEFLIYENGNIGDPTIVVRDWRTGCIEHPWPEAREKWEEIIEFMRQHLPVTEECKEAIRQSWIAVCPDEERVFKECS